MIAFVGGFALAGEPVAADKRAYFLTAEASGMVRGGDGVVGSFGLNARASDHWLLSAGIRTGVTTPVPHVDGVYRDEGLQPWVGVAYAPLGVGLHGLSAGVRVMAGGTSYWQSREWGAPLVDLPGPGLTIGVQPNVRATWISWPGLTLGAEVGANVEIGPDRMAGPLVVPTAALTAGWSVPTSAAALRHPVAAPLTPEQIDRRKRANRNATVVLVAVPATLVTLGAFWFADFASGPVLPAM